MIGGLLSDRMSKKIPLILIFIALVGCIGQNPAPPQTETPTPTPGSNAIEIYGKQIGLQEKIIEILMPADTDGILDEKEKKILDFFFQIPEEEQFKWAQWLMMDKQIKDDEVGEIEKIAKGFEEEKTRKEEEEKDRQERLKNTEKAKQELELLKDDTFTLEDGIQTEIEKNFLANPNDQKLAQDLKKYYLGEIEKIYPELATELNKLPELSPLNANKKSLEALEDIYGLLLTAEPYKNYDDRFKSNIPKENETWEAFELMIKGGTPDPKDYTYSVPDYNTELQALLWIAEQNEFKKNDTLALAIAMDNGLYLTMGDEQVRVAVYKDMNDLLELFRETNLWQLENGYYLLEDYPLEAKICLTWTGNQTTNFGPHALIWGIDMPLDTLQEGYLSKGRHLDIKGYKWNTVSIVTLKRMRDIAINNSWWRKDNIETNSILEDYFYVGDSPHWTSGHPIGNFNYIEVDGEKVFDFVILNIDFEMSYFLKTGNFIGTCNDEASWIDAWMKSLGFATNIFWRGGIPSQGEEGLLVKHWITSFFDPSSNRWKANIKQLQIDKRDAGDLPLLVLTIHKPPISFENYLKAFPDFEFAGIRWGMMGNNKNIYFFYPSTLKLSQIIDMFTKGISTSQMKQWLLYSSG